MAQAGEWRAIATRVADRRSAGAAAVEGVRFEGPAAERARAAARSPARPRGRDRRRPARAGRPR